MEHILNEETLLRWFSSNTDANSQLTAVISKNNFSKKPLLI